MMEVTRRVCRLAGPARTRPTAAADGTHYCGRRERTAPRGANRHCISYSLRTLRTRSFP